jgi:hypothetical protein
MQKVTREMKAATIALVVRSAGGKTPEIVDILSDDREISVLETEVGAGEGDPLQRVYEFRTSQTREDDEFADYVEDLLSQPFVKPEIQEHGVQWLRSKLRIEEYQKNEAEAARVIADYAIKVFSGDPERRDFLLAGPRKNVRVRIFVIDSVRALDAA